MERNVVATVDKSTTGRAFLSNGCCNNACAGNQGADIVPVTRLARLGDFAFRRRRLVLAAWIGALVAAVRAVRGVRWSRGPEDYATPGSESKAAADCTRAALPGQLARHRRRRLEEPRTGARADGLPALRPQLAAQGLGRRGASLTSRPTGTIAVARLQVTMLPSGSTGGDRQAASWSIGLGRAHVELGGQVIQVAQQATDLLGGGRHADRGADPADPRFGTLVAAGLPLVTGALRPRHRLGGWSALLAAVLDIPDWSTDGGRACSASASGSTTRC